jgi:hypothetical protein
MAEPSWRPRRGRRNRAASFDHIVERDASTLDVTEIAHGGAEGLEILRDAKHPCRRYTGAVRSTSGHLRGDALGQITLVINMKTAKALEMTLSPSLQLQADQIIE